MEEITVLKFGGTSISSAEKIKKVARYINRKSKSKKAVVVVSARGKETDRLITLAREVSEVLPLFRNWISCCSPERFNLLLFWQLL